MAVCQPPMTLKAGVDCTAHDVNIDAGSCDEDGDGFSLAQEPQASSPLPIGDTSVKLTVSDGTLSFSCTTTVTVTNNSPDITPIEESTVLVGGSVRMSVTASDPESHDLIYSWGTGDCPGAAIVDDGTATPTLSIAAGTSPGICQVSVKVSDSCDDFDENTATVRPMTLLTSFLFSLLLLWISSRHGFPSSS